MVRKRVDFLRKRRGFPDLGRRVPFVDADVELPALAKRRLERDTRALRELVRVCNGIDRVSRSETEDDSPALQRWVKSGVRIHDVYGKLEN
ncbi:MAG: hypothetical protein WCC25_17240 [Candidatus Korobacteraceae bacterium]